MALALHHLCWVEGSGLGGGWVGVVGFWAII